MSDLGPDLVLVRHGEGTEWSLSGRHTGRTDLDLTAGGEAQAKAVATSSATPLDLILTSPMRRARRTAELAGLTPYELDDDLKGVGLRGLRGDLTSPGVSTDLARFGPSERPWPGGETDVAVAARAAARAARPARRAGRASSRSRAHGHILRVLAARWLDQDVGVGQLLALDTATVSEAAGSTTSGSSAAGTSPPRDGSVSPAEPRPSSGWGPPVPPPGARRRTVRRRAGPPALVEVAAPVPPGPRGAPGPAAPSAPVG